MTAPTVLDARGHRCPVPALRLRKAMAQAGPDRRLILLADDPMARIDVPHMLGQSGGKVVDIRHAEAWLEITVETPAAPAG